VSRAVILSAVRTPVGRYGGGLAGVRPDDLAAAAIAEAVSRSSVDPAAIEDVYLGCANQAGEDNRNVARMAALLAGLPVEVAGQTVNRLCGSGLQAINAAAHAIGADDGDVFIRSMYFKDPNGVTLEFACWTKVLDESDVRHAPATARTPVDA